MLASDIAIHILHNNLLTHAKNGIIKMYFNYHSIANGRLVRLTQT